MSRWRHDTIVPLYGLCLAPFYTMSQRMQGGKLDVFLKKRGASFQLHHCIQVTGQLAQAIMYLVSCIILYPGNAVCAT